MLWIEHVRTALATRHDRRSLLVAALALAAPGCEVCDFERISTDSLPNGSIGTRYSTDIDIDTKCGPEYVDFLLVGGTLPPGLSLSPRGRIDGTPQQPGAFNFTVDVEVCFVDNGLRFADCSRRSKGFTITVNP